jgi:hypothetical protein
MTAWKSRSNIPSSLLASPAAIVLGSAVVQDAGVWLTIQRMP